MDTYAPLFTDFQQSLQQAIKQIGYQKLGVGLMTWNVNASRPFTTEELKQRFSVIDSLQINEIDIWDMTLQGK